MKLLFVGILLLYLCEPFNKDSCHEFLLKNGFRFIPKGNLNLENNSFAISSFYLFETEISNKEYNEFLNELKNKNSLNEYLIAKVDSSGWNKILNFTTQFFLNYHKEISAEDYPVVNISHRAAVLYCEWLTNKFNKNGFNIQVRLPNRIEWIYAAKGGNVRAVYSNKENLAIDNEGYTHIIFNGMIDCNGVKCTDCFMGKTTSGKPNKFGLYNMCGNVAEMLEEGGTKGGSFHSDADHVRIEGEDEYSGVTEPSPYIGFRPIAIIQ